MSGKRNKGRSKGFQWVREDVEGEAVEPIERVSHREIREEDAAVEELVVAIAAAPPSRQAQLPLSPDLAAALVEYRRLEGSAGRRQLRRLKKLARGQDLDALRQALEGETDAERRLRHLERWRSRILSDGDSAIHEFVTAHEGVEHQTLRSLARTAGADTPAGQRAAKKLFQVLKGARPLPEPPA
jgi:ribosome-associated protein